MNDPLLDEDLIDNVISVFGIDVLRCSDYEIIDFYSCPLESFVGARGELDVGVAGVWKVIEGNHRLLII
jgi:hypothetical protein